MSGAIFFGPRLWDPENAPDSESPEPATCLDCGDVFDDALPCPCHEPTDVAA